MNKDYLNQIAYGVIGALLTINVYFLKKTVDRLDDITMTINKDSNRITAIETELNDLKIYTLQKK